MLAVAVRSRRGELGAADFLTFVLYLDSSFVQNCFGDVSIINSKEELEKLVNSSFENGENILLMSSGTFQKASFLFD